MPLERYPVNRVIATKNELKNVIAGVYRPNKNDVVSVLVNAVPEIDHDGNISQVIVTFMDITEHKRMEERIEGLNRLKEDLLGSGSLVEKMKRITDSVVGILGADFVRIWLTKRGDMCDSGCMHAKVSEGPHVCRNRNRCLHLISSSGRYTHIDGAHGC